MITLTDEATKPLERIQELYLTQPGIMFSHLHTSYNHFVDERLPAILGTKDLLQFYEGYDVNTDNMYKYYFRFSNISYKPPKLNDNDNELMYPYHARDKQYTYYTKIYANVEHIQETTNLTTHEVTTKVIESKTDPINFINLPILLKSNKCNLTLNNTNKGECKYDYGGYFIIGGQERILIPYEKPIDNRVLVYKKVVSGKSIYYANVSSKDETGNLTQKINIRFKGQQCLVSFLYFKDIDLVNIIRLLGITRDSDIVNYICPNVNDVEMRSKVHEMLRYAVSGRSEKEIYEYVYSKMALYINSKESLTDERKLKYRNYIDVVKHRILPHESKSMLDKAIFLCYMVNRLLTKMLGREPVDDRDNHEHKRIMCVGPLLEEVFRKYLKKTIDKIKKYFQTKQPEHSKPPFVLSSLCGTTIDQGIRTSFMTGKWLNKPGISQLMQRNSFLYTISFKKTIVSVLQNAQSKLVEPRHYHASQCGFICPAETPEGRIIGTVKHLSMATSITIDEISQKKIIYDYLKKRIIEKTNVDPLRLHVLYKVFINGEWLGVVDNVLDVYQEVHERKLNNVFSPTISVTYDVTLHELHIWTDEGRFYRPVFRVVDNKTMLTDEMIARLMITDKRHASYIKNWAHFITEYPGVIEYITNMEYATTLLCDRLATLKAEQAKMLSSVKSPQSIILNRYDDTRFVHYTHMEIDPVFCLGLLEASLPFSHMNPGTRNIFQYSQGRHALDIYATNYRYRRDIASILYFQHRPLVNSKFAKYIHTDKLSSGENAIVAIMCYSGYNQEDSIIFNKAAIERGLFSVTLMKKVSSSLQKTNEEFMKPDPTLVNIKKRSNYSKLNEHGYVPVGTEVVNKDILISKVASTSAGKYKYNDVSEEYKSPLPSMVDSVVHEKNGDGVDAIKLGLRSERLPQIGNKFVSRNAQKGTIGNILNEGDMPYTENGIIPSLIINPNAIPSRRTIGQITETVAGKIGAIEGAEIDGTTFNEIDYDGNIYDIGNNQSTLDAYCGELGNRLEAHGFQRYGFEVMYNGLTGERMKSLIFIGPTFYRPLKHIVSEKIHARQTGTVQMLTHQPPEGRAKLGGLRLGNMERDCIVAGEHVSLSCGNSVPIENILCNTRNVNNQDHVVNNDNDYVLSINDKHSIDTSQQVTCHISKGKRRYITLTLEDNTTLKCTPEHRMYTYNIIKREYAYKKVTDIMTAVDKIVCSAIHAIPVKKYTPELSIRLSKARICALCDTTSHITEDTAVVYVDTEDDRQQVMRDLSRVIPNIDKIESTLVWYKTRSVYKMTTSDNANLSALFTIMDIELDTPEEITEYIATYLGRQGIETGTNNEYIRYHLEDTYGFTINNNKTYIANVLGLNLDVCSFIKFNKLIGIRYNNELACTINLHAKYLSIKGRDKFNAYMSQVHYNASTRTYCLAVQNISELSTHAVDVYDISVPVNLSFVVNGMVVHNCIISHGAGSFLKEKMMESSDLFTVHVCNTCGSFAKRIKTRATGHASSQSDTFECELCSNKTSISKVNMPYAMKLFTQENISMNIKPSFIPAKTNCFSPNN